MRSEADLVEDLVQMFDSEPPSDCVEYESIWVAPDRPMIAGPARTYRGIEGVLD